ncbi:hypothetical protein ACMXYV_02810 [Neptuniibacter sp. SY11_33]|uniref:hypothetical protein n=1 Tax=Neptuniibacter sp. SY11_33 TaxID=3398215 RepID=UPI0039F52703
MFILSYMKGNFVNLSRLDKGLGNIGFFLLYPAFFFYHVFLALDFLPDFLVVVLKGFYGPVSVLLLVLYFFRFTLGNKGNSFSYNLVDKLFFLYVAWAGVWVLWNLYSLTEWYVFDASVQILKSIVLQTVNFFIGLLLFVKFKDRSFYMLYFFWFFMVLFTLSNVHPETLTLHNTLSAKFIEGVASYQGLSRSLMLVSLLLISLIHCNYTRLIITFLSATALFFIGARSELVGFLLGVGAFELVVASIDRRYAFFLLGLSFLLILGGGYYLQDILVSLDGSRMLNMLSLSSDASWNSRSAYTLYAIETILNEPLWGGYGSHFLVGALDGGAYSHSLLSAWVALGLPGMLLITVLVVFCALQAFKNVLKSKRKEPIWCFALLLGAAIVPQILFVKSAFTIWFPLFFGVVAQAIRYEYLNRQSEV